MRVICSENWMLLHMDLVVSCCGSSMDTLVTGNRMLSKMGYQVPLQAAREVVDSSSSTGLKRVTSERMT